MKRDDLTELHYITPVANLRLILEHGLLSNRGSKRFGAESVALETVQEKRAKKVIPGGRPLHDYANLYICARNPMMYKRRGRELVVVRLSPDVLDLAGVAIADGNAASDYTAFWPSPDGLRKISKAEVFAENWSDSDRIVHWRNARVKCAEVLVPGKVETRFIIGFYVPNIEAKEKIVQTVGEFTVDVNPHLFFRD